MIFDKNDNLKFYENALPALKTVREILEAGNEFEIGKHFVNDDLFYIVQEYVATKTESDYEFHEKYIDVQVLLEGKEYIDYENFNDTKIVKEYNPEKDAGKSVGENASRLLLKAGEFALFFPHDAHAPGIKYDENIVRKIVFKVKA